MKQKYMYTYRCMSKLFSLFCLETNKMNIKGTLHVKNPAVVHYSGFQYKSPKG